MNRRSLIPLGMALTVLAMLVLVFQAPTPAPASPEPAPEAVQVIPLPPAAAPPSRVVLRRPAPEPQAIQPEEPVEIEAAEEVPFAPADLLELPEEDLARLTPKALELMRDLDEACGHLAEDGGTNVAIAMTVDGRGLLEMELGDWSGETAEFTGELLPGELVDCLDDAVWDLDWPTWEGGLRFSLTTTFDPAEG